MDSSVWFGDSLLYISRVYTLLFPNIIVLSFFLHRADPDDIAAFHQGLHCLPKYAFRSHKCRKG